MKRMGFVSNSSSSSFIVGFSKRPKDAKEMKKVLFGSEKRYLNPFCYDDKDARSWDTDLIATIVWNDIERQSSALKHEILNELNSGYIEEIDKELDKLDYRDDDYVEKRDAILDKYSEKHAEKFAGKEVYIFKYEDNTSIGAAMEHGGLFKNLPYIRVSNH